MDRPTLFLSSTVYDFADLRSALKDYLELRGCRVLASEFVDFTPPLDKHSYDACLKTIEQADIFVLFIGRRVGGWYNALDQISITRAEYRRAYELANEGKIRILCFVRSDVWEHRQSVRDLANELKRDPLLTEHQREKICNHPTAAMDNAGAISSFIDEVTRNNETTAAVKGLGTAPIANWIWPFATFTQVRQAIDPLVINGLSVHAAAGRKALEAQLVAMLQNIMPKSKDSAFNPINAVLNVVKQIGLSSSNLVSTVRMSKETWKNFVALGVNVFHVRVDPTPLQAHLSSGLLLEYDPAAGIFKQTAQFDLLIKVIDLANELTRTAISNPAALLMYGTVIDKNGEGDVPAEHVVVWAHRMLRWVDLIQTIKALVRSLTGQLPVVLKPVPSSPILDQVEMLEQEVVTPEQVRRYINEEG